MKLFEYLFASLEEKREVVGVLTRLLEVREEQLERRSLPVGSNNGPDSTVTPVVLVK